jgi:hypothetical protein
MHCVLLTSGESWHDRWMIIWPGESRRDAWLRIIQRVVANVGTQSGLLLLRDILGNPFRPVAIDPAWLRWHDRAVVHIAQTIYDQHRFQDLRLLADALEEAGCTDPAILGHCRGQGEHVRGCWVVDLVLDKK